MRRHLSPRSLVVLLILALAACAVSDFDPATVSRAPVDVPERFQPVSSTGEAVEWPARGAGCLSPMVDPRDGTQIRLVRSGSEQGDYAVADGRYGVGPGEWLRLDCATGRVVGIVSG